MRRRRRGSLILSASPGRPAYLVPPSCAARPLPRRVDRLNNRLCHSTSKRRHRLFYWDRSFPFVHVSRRYPGRGSIFFAILEENVDLSTYLNSPSTWARSGLEGFFRKFMRSLSASLLSTFRYRRSLAAPLRGAFCSASWLRRRFEAWPWPGPSRAPSARRGFGCTINLVPGKTFSHLQWRSSDDLR